MAELARRAAQSPNAFDPTQGAGIARPDFDLNHLLVTGMYPRIHDRGLESGPWLDGYLRTYVERDVRLLSGVGDLDGNLVPIEVRSSETLPEDAFSELDRFIGLSGDPGGIVVTGGDTDMRHRSHAIVPWWKVS